MFTRSIVVTFVLYVYS